MNCPDCAAAAAQPWHAFRASCRGCSARSLARSPAFFESRRDRVQHKAYRDALKRTGLEHFEVVDAFAKDFLSTHSQEVKK